MPVRLKTVYDAPEEIPDGFADLYAERNGKMELVGVEGVKTQSDVDRVQEALRKERADLRIARDTLAKFGDIDPEGLHDRLEELEVAKVELDTLKKEGKLNPEQLEPIIEARVNRATGPLAREKSQLQRDLDNARKTLGEREQEIGSLKGTIVQSTVERSIRDAAINAKVVPTAIDDAVLNGTRIFEVTEDGKVVTKNIPGVVAGLAPSEWFKDMQDKRPHWWPPSVGGGAGAGGRGGLPNRADNPWSKEGWNLTKQGQLVRADQGKAEQMAKAVGSSIGATKPAE